MQGELAVKERALSREEALEVAARCAEVLKARFGATRVIVFGSAAGQAPWHKGSDLDLAVEGLASEKYWEALRALDEIVPPSLEVDLVPLESAYPEMRARIVGEVEMPKDPVLALKSLIEDEFKALDRIVSQTEELGREMHDPPSWIELRAIGSLIHDFYSGVESIFRRIAIQFNGSEPRGEHWHQDLLSQMNLAREGKRPAVIDSALWSRLEGYLKFRHFFRNAYAIPFEWDRMSPHVQRMPETLALLRDQFDRFFAAVSPE